MGIAVQGGQIVVQYQNCDLDTKTTSKVQSSPNFTKVSQISTLRQLTYNPCSPCNIITNITTSNVESDR